MNDEPDNWSTASVTVEQHTDGRLQDSQSMWDLEMVTCNVQSALSRDDALKCFSLKGASRQDESCGQHRCSVGFGSETSMSLSKQVTERSV